MARPRKKETDKQTRFLVARATEAEFACAVEKAGRAGLSLSEYVRRMAIDGHVIVRQESAYSGAIAIELRAIGVNLNQLTRRANFTGKMPPALAHAYEQLSAVLDRVLQMD